MTMTARANRANFAVAFAPQTAKGTPASSGVARCFAAESFDDDPQREFIHPQGSTGSLLKKDTFRNVTLSPVVSASFMGSRQALGPLLEMMTFGAPTVGAGQFTEAGESNNQLSTWTFSGARPGFNTLYTAALGCVLYVKVLTNVIYVYKDAALASLVAQGNAANGTVTLAAMNSSGLSGTVACTTATPTDNAAITVTINTISMNFAKVPSVYWTCFADDGKKLRTISDCVMKSITFTSRDRGPLMINVVLWGMERTVGATALTPTIAANDVYAHNGDLVMRNDTAGSPVTQQPTDISFNFDRDCSVLMGTGTRPQDVISKLIECTLDATLEPTSELDTVLGLVDTFDEIDLKWTNGSKLFALAATKVAIVNPKHPEFSGDDAQPVQVKWTVLEETATTPAAAITMSYQP